MTYDTTDYTSGGLRVKKWVKLLGRRMAREEKSHRTGRQWEDEAAVRATTERPQVG